MYVGAEKTWLFYHLALVDPVPKPAKNQTYFDKSVTGILSTVIQSLRLW